MKWWTEWKQRRTNGGVVKELLDEGEIRRRLMARKATEVRNNYFNPVITVPTSTPDTRALQELEDEELFADALFVRQMHVALY